MPEITLTQFIDYAIASGTPKLTVVRRIRAQHIAGYHPSRDFYKRIREAIADVHRENLGRQHLDHVLDGLTDAKKIRLYPNLIRGYKRFMGRREFEWFDPPEHVHWRHGNLIVKINPELGLEIDGEPHLIKLYFKSEPLSQSRIELINHLVMQSLDDAADDLSVAVLDVKSGRLLNARPFDPSLAPLLHGEALSFCAVYAAQN